MLICDQPGTLLTSTLALLKEDPRPLLTLYEETGIPYHWLKSFSAGKIQNPSVNRIECLREKLLIYKNA